MMLWTIPPTVCFSGSTSQFVGPIIPPVEIVGACILEFLELENKKPGLCDTAGSGCGTLGAVPLAIFSQINASGARRLPAIPMRYSKALCLSCQ